MEIRRKEMKKCLIVVDYQNDFVDGSLGFDEAPKLDEVIASIVEEYHENGDEVIFTMDTHDNKYLETQEGKSLPVVHCLDMSHGQELYGKTKESYDDDLIFKKNTYGSIDLFNYLKTKNYESITFVGVVTNICVMSNAVLAKTALPEVPIYIKKTGVGSNDAKLNEEALDVMRSLNMIIIE